MLAMGQHLDDLTERCAVEMKMIFFLSLFLEASNDSAMLNVNCLFLSFSDCRGISDEQKERLTQHLHSTVNLSPHSTRSHGLCVYDMVGGGVLFG